MAFLNESGLAYFLARIKAWCSSVFAEKNHGTHVTYSTSAPAAAGTASAGVADSVSRGDHVHPLQTSVSGNAGTATKLATARTISPGDYMLMGGASFDGSADKSLEIKPYSTTANVAGDNSNPYFVIASTPVAMAQECSLVLLVDRAYTLGGAGVCMVHYRANNSAGSAVVKWLCRNSDLPEDAISAAFKDTSSGSCCDVFYHADATYRSSHFYVLGQSNTRYNTGAGKRGLALNLAGSVPKYATMSAAVTALHGGAYTSVVEASD